MYDLWVKLADGAVRAVSEEIDQNTAGAPSDHLYLAADPCDGVLLSSSA